MAFNCVFNIEEGIREVNAVWAYIETPFMTFDAQTHTCALAHLLRLKELTLITPEI